MRDRHLKFHERRDNLVAMSAAGLVEWLTLLAADRAVVVLEHLNRHSDAERAAPPANHYRSRPAE